MNIFVGGAFNNDIPDIYKEMCKDYLEKVLVNNDLVFGGSNSGLMKVIYDTAVKCNSKITAACPELFKDGLNQINVNEGIVTPTMIESTVCLFKKSDAFIILPGGIGTLYELFNILQVTICKEIDIPIIIYNPDHFYDGLISMLEKMNEENFISNKSLNLIHVSDNYQDTIDYINEKTNHV